MKKNKKKIFLITLSCLMIILLASPLLGSCSLINIIDSSYSEGPHLVLRDIDFDDREVESIRILNKKMEKSYDISQEISSIADELENPFKPFYIGDGSDDVKNIIILQNIYSEEGIDYCEIKFNDFTYILTQDDSFNNIYLVRSINDSSVVLLKGDEILTLFMGEMLND